MPNVFNRRPPLKLLLYPKHASLCFAPLAGEGDEKKNFSSSVTQRDNFDKLLINHTVKIKYARDACFARVTLHCFIFTVFGSHFMI